MFNSLNVNTTKWSHTLKQFLGSCSGMFDHFVGLAIKGLKDINNKTINLTELPKIKQQSTQRHFIQMRPMNTISTNYIITDLKELDVLSK